MNWRSLTTRTTNACVLLAGTLLLVDGAGATERLAFLTWADYLSPELVEEFEREHDVRIEFSYFESDDHRDEILADSEGRGYDLVMLNGVMVQTYADRNLLMPLSVEQIPGLANIDARWSRAFPAAERYGAAYFWGTLGIGYRRDLVPEGFSSWRKFFAPSETLRGRISMLSNSRDVVGMALKSLGHSANSEDRAALLEAGKLLEAQKPFVRSYEYVQLGEQSALVTGEIWASMMYSGDALLVQDHDENIVYVVPDEGGNLWADYVAILQTSPRQDLAAKFIDFLNRPEVAARNAEHVYYATPNLAAAPYLSEEYYANPVIHPSQDVLDRSESYREIAPRAQKTLNSVFAAVIN